MTTQGERLARIEESIKNIDKNIDELKGCITPVPSLRAQTKIQWWFIGGIAFALLASFVKDLFAKH